MEKRCTNCKWQYLTGSSEPCKSCMLSSKRNLNWEPKEKDEKYYAIGMPVRYSWGGPDPDNIRTGFIVENSDYKRGFYVIKDDRDGYKYNISTNRILGYNVDDYKIGDIVRYHVMDVNKTELKEGKIVSKDSVHYDFRITDIFDGMTWGVNKEWIVEKVVTNKDESSMHPSTIGEEFFINTGFRGGKTFVSECIKNNCESVKSFLNRVYGNPDFKPKVHSDAADSLSYSIKRKLDGIRSNAVYGLTTDLTFYDEFVNKEDNKMNNQKKRNRNIIKVKNDCPSEIKEVIFNGPATIIKWQPTNDSLFFGDAKGEKTVVVCKDDEQNMTVGFLLAVVKGLVDNQSYDNILRKIDGFSKFDIPQVGYEYVFKFKVGDIVRFKHGTARFKVDKCTTFTASSGKEVPRYRITRLLGSKCSYSAYANENELVLADEVYQK